MQMSWPRLRAKHTSAVYSPDKCSRQMLMVAGYYWPEFTQSNVEFCKEPRALGRETKKWPSGSHAMRDHQNNGQPNARYLRLLWVAGYNVCPSIFCNNDDPGGAEMKNSVPETVYLSNVSSVSPTNLMVATRLFMSCAHAACLDHKFKLGCHSACVPLSFSDEDRDTQVAAFPDSQVGSGLDSRQYWMEHGHGQSTIYKKFSCDRCEGIGLSVATSIMNHGCLHGIRDHVNVWFLLRMYDLYQTVEFVISPKWIQLYAMKQ